MQTLHSTFIPPMINGVNASQVYLPKFENRPHSLFDFLCEKFPHITPTEWQQRFQDQLIFDEQGQILTLHSMYLENTHIYYYRFLAHEITVPFKEEILFENEHFIAIDKPHFLTISPTGKYLQETLLVRLKKQTQNPNLTPIHRLDRETAGLVLFSKCPDTRGIYQQLFAERQVQKLYHAIAPFNADLKFPQTVQLRMEKGHPFYTMQVVTGEVNSITEIDLIEHNFKWAKYQLKPETGKQHQLRVHLNHLNIPIKNDPFYPEVSHKDDADFSQPLQLLAKELAFFDPISQQKMYFISKKELTLA
ncbi:MULTISPECIES: pseudouridine synthase [unclassified Acinetobacter]|uniref:pseudouridine synthase n=1 Tax=unclassified Acinetobacter TaxID=196816 RepID=UPI0025791A49|nr:MULTISPECIES: pseudouridine synthase [unclassified Acinetobacter]